MLPRQVRRNFLFRDHKVTIDITAADLIVVKRVLRWHTFARESDQKWDAEGKLAALGEPCFVAARDAVERLRHFGGFEFNVLARFVLPHDLLVLMRHETSGAAGRQREHSQPASQRTHLLNSTDRSLAEASYLIGIGSASEEY